MLEDAAALDDYLDDATETPSGLSDSQACRLEDEVRAEVPGLNQDPGLGLMLELARRGEYDPWNVDIVALTDRYLEALDEQLDAQELGNVARLIFYAAALIHLKARALAEQEALIRAEEEAVLLDEVFDELAGDLCGSRLRPDDLPLVYPDFMTGEGPRGALSLSPRERPPRKRGVTLVDLISALRTYDERLAQREAELADEPVFDADMAFQECVEGSHQDDLDKDLVEIRQELWERLPEGGSVTLDSLVHGERTLAGAYLALLFLAQDEEVLIEQDAFYGEVRVVRGQYFGEVRAGVHDLDDDEEREVWSDEEAGSSAEPEQEDGIEAEEDVTADESEQAHERQESGAVADEEEEQEPQATAAAEEEQQ